MVERDITISIKYHSYLAENIQLPYFARALLDSHVIHLKDYEKLLSRNSREECSRLLLKLYRKCSSGLILQCLEDSGHEDLCREVESGTQPVHKAKMYAIPPACGLNLESQKLIENFSDKVKMKIHNAEARDCMTKFEAWSRTLLNAIKRGSLDPIDERKYADCCFVLLDALVVLYRTHSENRKSLFGKEEFKSMEYLISKTAHPTLTKIRYHSRFGVSLFQGDRIEKGLQYLSLALGDATLYMSGKDIGNIIFALVNIKLELYARNSNTNLKKEILDYIESGIQYFENENEDARNNWRCIYLDKKTCCLLGLNSDGETIEGAEVDDQDLENANSCLLETEQYDTVIDIRRRMHFYRAKAKYYNYVGKHEISEGYLKEALELAKKGGFHHDEKILLQQCPSTEKPSEKQAIEHNDNDGLSGSDIDNDRNFVIESKDLDQRALQNIAKALHLETFGIVSNKEPTEN